MTDGIVTGALRLADQLDNGHGRPTDLEARAAMTLRALADELQVAWRDRDTARKAVRRDRAMSVGPLPPVTTGTVQGRVTPTVAPPRAVPPAPDLTLGLDVA